MMGHCSVCEVAMQLTPRLINESLHCMQSKLQRILLNTLSQHTSTLHVSHSAHINLTCVLAESNRRRFFLRPKQNVFFSLKKILYDSAIDLFRNFVWALIIRLREHSLLNCSLG